jgi:hypothetical protein
MDKAAGIEAGPLFRRVSSAGRAWGEGVTEKAVWRVVKEFAAKIGVTKLERTISVGVALGSAAPLAANGSRFNSFVVTSRSVPLSAISAALSGFHRR